MTDLRIQVLADAFRSVFGDSSGHSPEQTARWFAAMHDADHAIRSVPHDVFDLRDKSALPDDGGGLGPDDFERAGLPQQDKSASPQRAAIVAADHAYDAAHHSQCEHGGELCESAVDPIVKRRCRHCPFLQQESEVVQHSEELQRPRGDKSAAPLVGADPPQAGHCSDCPTWDLCSQRGCPRRKDPQATIGGDPPARDSEMVESYLGAFFDHALKTSPNSATAINGRNAALVLVAAVRDETLRIAAAHLTDDAVVDALLVEWYVIRPEGLRPTHHERKKMRAALAAAGKAWLGDAL